MELPKHIKQKIEERVIKVAVLHEKPFRLGAEFGYSLAQQELEQSLLLYNNQTATIVKLQQEIKERDEEIKRLSELIDSLNQHTLNNL